MGLCFSSLFLKAQKTLILICFVIGPKHFCGTKIFSKDIQQVGGGTVLLFRLTSWPTHGKRKMGSQLFKKMTVVIPVDAPMKHGGLYRLMSLTLHDPWQHPTTKGQAKKPTTDGEETYTLVEMMRQAVTVTFLSLF